MGSLKNFTSRNPQPTEITQAEAHGKLLFFTTTPQNKFYALSEGGLGCVDVRCDTRASRFACLPAA